MSDTTLFTNPDAIATALAKMLIDMGAFAPQSDKLWTKKQCAEYVGCSTVHVDYLIHERGLPFIEISKPGGKSRDLRFSPIQVKAWELQQSTNQV